METSKHKRSTSTTKPPSRPTTPLRPSSRTSLRSGPSTPNPYNASSPLSSLEPAFAEFSDSMADLEANFMHLQLMHESLSRFSESFASFLYGLNMNAFCVDFPEAPIKESFSRARKHEDTEGMMGQGGNEDRRGEFDAEATFMTTDTSFVENPPVSSRSSKFATPAPPARPSSGLNRGGGTLGRGGIARGAARGTRGSGLARAKPRGVR